MSDCYITLLQPNPTTGALSDNVAQLNRLLTSVPDVAGPQLVVIPIGAIEGITGAKALLSQEIYARYRAYVQLIVAWAQDKTALLLGYWTPQGEKRALFSYHGAVIDLDLHSVFCWEGLLFSLSENEADAIALRLDSTSTAAERFQPSTHQTMFFVGCAGGEATSIAAGDSGYYSSGESQRLVPWQSGVIQFVLRGTSSNARQIACSYRSAPVYEACADDQRYEALRAGLRDYVTKAHIRGIVLGLSGGIDSALCLSLAVDAMGASNVKGLLLPSRYTSEESLQLAGQLAQQLGVQTETLSIEPLFQSALATLHPIFGEKPWDLTEENLQARARAMLLMGVANKEGRLLLCTTNKAEAAMGYGTLYGDVTGGYAPIIDLWKHDVQSLCLSRNASSSRPWIPEAIIYRAPTAELHEGQLDSDSLPPYHQIATVIEALLQGSSLEEERRSLGSEVVDHIVSRFFANAFKRAQGIPGPALSPIALSQTLPWGIGGRWQ